MVHRKRIYIFTWLTHICCIAVVVTIVTGCQSQQPIFPAREPALTWPAHSKPRFSYIGELKQAKDLKAVRPWWQRLGDFIFGADAPKKMYGPRSVLVIEDHLVWIADPGGRCLHLFNLMTREYKKVPGVAEGDDETKFHSPVGLCKGPGDTFFVCDSVNAEVYQFHMDGGFLRKIHLMNDVDRPTALCFVPELQSLYILDTKSHDIKVYTLDGRLVKIIGKRGVMPGEFNVPIDLVYDGELLWVSDSCNGRVQSVTLDGKPVQVIGRMGKQPGEFALPKGLGIDSGKRVFVVDSRFENIQIFNAAGQLLMHIGHEGSSPGEFSLPSGIFIDSKDRIWVCDTYNHRIQLFETLTEVGEHAE